MIAIAWVTKVVPKKLSGSLKPRLAILQLRSAPVVRLPPEGSLSCDTPPRQPMAPPFCWFCPEFGGLDQWCDAQRHLKKHKAIDYSYTHSTSGCLALGVGGRLLQDWQSPNPRKCWGECWEECREKRDCWGTAGNSAGRTVLSGKAEERHSSRQSPQQSPLYRHSSQHSPRHFWGFRLCQSFSRWPRSQV